MQHKRHSQQRQLPGDRPWLDRRHAPGTGLYHVYGSYSRDGGLSFVRNLRLTDEVSDAAHDGFGGTNIGWSTGVAARAGAAHVLWGDTRGSNGVAEGYAGGWRIPIRPAKPIRKRRP